MRSVNRQSSCTLALVFACLLLASEISFGSECKVIRTTVTGSSFLCGESPVGLCSDGVIAGSILKGTKVAVYTAGAPTAGLWTEGPSILSYTAGAIFTTKHGDLYLNQLGVMDIARKVYTEVNRVVGGTGRFHQARGDLFISGGMSTSDLATEFDGEITGTLCLADSTEED